MLRIPRARKEYIEYLRKDYANAIKLWRERYRELSKSEWVEGIDLAMKYGGKKQWIRDFDIYEEIIMRRYINRIKDKDIKILDAGCGYGFFLYQLYLV